MIFLEKIESLHPEISTELIETCALTALKHQAAPEDSELTIVLSDDDQLHELNLHWMGVDAPTDVLSFPSEEIDPETGNRYLGDIIISVQRAAEQAQSAGHSAEDEVQLLTVHGILHLMGYDHGDPKGKAIMWKSQAEILSLLGLPNLQIME